MTVPSRVRAAMARAGTQAMARVSPQSRSFHAASITVRPKNRNSYFNAYGGEGIGVKISIGFLSRLY